MRRTLLVIVAAVLSVVVAGCSVGDRPERAEGGDGGGDTTSTVSASGQGSGAASTTSPNGSQGGDGGGSNGAKPEFCTEFTNAVQAQLPAIESSLQQIQGSTGSLDPENPQAALDAFAAFGKAFLPVFEAATPAVPSELSGDWGPFVDGFRRIANGEIASADPSQQMQFSDASQKVGDYLKTACGYDMNAGLGGLAGGGTPPSTAAG